MAAQYIQATPKAPSYEAAPIPVRANIATPQATMQNVSNQQKELNMVNNLSGGSRKSKRRNTKTKVKNLHSRKHIRTYKGRRYIEQNGGAGEQIPIPQVGQTCSSGPQCAGAQNAVLTETLNQASSNSINDAYATGGGRRGRRGRHVRHGHHHHTHHHHHTRRSNTKSSYSLTSRIAYNIKKVMRKVFS
jgi:hypothetical protein